MLIYLTIEVGESIESKKKKARVRAQEERNSILFLFAIQRTKCPPFGFSVRQPCSLPLAARKGISGNFMSPARRAEYSALLDYAHRYPTASGVFDAA